MRAGTCMRAAVTGARQSVPAKATNALGALPVSSQGRRVTEDSLYYYAWVECANALHHQRRQRQRAGIIALKQLTTMVGYVFVPGQRPEEPGAGGAGADPAL